MEAILSLGEGAVPSGESLVQILDSASKASTEEYSCSNKQSVTDMNWSHIELVQTLVSDEVSPATEKNWSGVLWYHHQGT